MNMLKKDKLHLKKVLPSIILNIQEEISEDETTADNSNLWLLDHAKKNLTELKELLRIART
jgi:hypothetical protein